MVEACGEESVKGRTETNHIVHFLKTTELKPGDCVNVTITHAGQHSLKGEFGNNSEETVRE